MKVTKAVNSKRKVSDEDIIAIRALREGGLTMAAIGVRYGLSHQYVSDICKGVIDTQADKLVKLQESLLAK
jgi:transcriptional regulator with XRE-family HTH domain